MEMNNYLNPESYLPVPGLLLDLLFFVVHWKEHTFLCLLGFSRIDREILIIEDVTICLVQM